MAEPAYEKALKRKKRLQEELRRVDEFLRLYDELIEELPLEVLPPAPAPKADRKGSVDQYTNPSREEVGKLAREFMLAKGRPMTRGEILAKLDEIGKPIRAQDPSKNIGTMMWRLREKFTNVEGHGYWPADVDLPEDIKKELARKAETAELLS